MVQTLHCDRLLYRLHNRKEGMTDMITKALVSQETRCRIFDLAGRSRRHREKAVVGSNAHD